MEYVDKLEAMNIILSQKIKSPCTRREQGFNEALDKVAESIVCRAHDAVVRCKDCKYSSPYNDGSLVCYNVLSILNPEDFCSFGRRKFETR